MSTPLVQGLPLHTRSLTVSVRPLADGRWMARGDVIDLRKNGFVPSSYDVQPSGIIHSMNIELDLDPETLRMETIRVEQPFVAVEPSVASRGECCRDPAPRLLDLTGECLDDKFAKKLSMNFGGPLGCSHLLTLFQLMSSAVPHATQIERARIAREGTEHAKDDRFFRRSVFVDGFEASDEITDVSVQLADTATRPFSPESNSFARLELSHEVKTFASVGRKTFGMDRLDIRERIRTAETLIDAEWVDRSEPFTSLKEKPIVPGLAGRVFKLAGDTPDLQVIKDNLLMFAPGYLQVIAAQMEPYFADQIRAAREGGEEMPSSNSLGGNTGACYMWRENGPIEKTGMRVTK